MEHKSFVARLHRTARAWKLIFILNCSMLHHPFNIHNGVYERSMALGKVHGESLRSGRARSAWMFFYRSCLFLTS